MIDFERSLFAPHELAAVLDGVRQRRFERRYGDRTEAFKRGYLGWATHDPAPNPFEQGTEDYLEYVNGAYWAEFDHDEDRSR